MRILIVRKVSTFVRAIERTCRIKDFVRVEDNRVDN